MNEDVKTNFVPICKELAENIHKMAIKWSTKHEWGVTLDDFRFSIFLHANGNNFIKFYVEEILEDCNFHTVNKMIKDGDYLNAYNKFKEDFDFGESEEDAE